MTVAYNMDCVQGMKTLADNSIDLTVTSPPYDEGNQNGKKRSAKSLGHALMYGE